MSNEKILNIIYSAISEANNSKDASEQILLAPDEVLYGASGKLDSLALVSLILDIEERISQEFGASLTLADDRAMSQHNSPFRTAAALADYIAMLLGEASQ